MMYLSNFWKFPTYVQIPFGAPEINGPIKLAVDCVYDLCICI